MILLLITLIFITFGYLWTKKRYSYWSSKRVEGPKPFPIVGNFGTVMAGKEHHDKLYQRIYNAYADKPYVGIYQAFKPTLLVRDPEIIKQILINEFSVFRNRGIEGAYPHNDQAFSTEGETWKAMRSVLSHSFTPGKLKSRIPLFEKCADDFLKYVDDSLASGSDYELQYDLMWRYNLHMNGVFLFGLDVKALSNVKNDFKHILDELFVPGLQSRIVMYVDQIIPGFQKLASKFNMDPRINPPSELLGTLVNNVVKGRQGQLAALNNFTEQMIDILKNQKVLEKQDKGIEFKRNDLVLVNQVLLTYVGQVNAASGFMSLFLHNLAVNKEIQDRVVKEIFEVTLKQNGKITYDSLKNMVYLEMVLNEVLRMYAVGFVQRQAVSGYEFPDTKLKIEKGTIIIIPVLGLHKDPKHFEDPEVFNPERFSPENKKNISDCTFLPFGAGPRYCVGSKSVTLQLKYGIAAFLRKFKVDTCERSQLQFHTTGITLTSTKGIWLKISKRTTLHND